MFARRRLPLALLLIGFLTLVAVPSRAQDQTREQRIADIEKQIGELHKQLAELKLQPAPGPVSKSDGMLSPAWVKQLNWRCIGPANMGGRIVALAVFEADPTTFWVATSSGGLLKTSNNGVTFEHQFDKETTVSIGDVAVAQSNKDIVWVGTGENNPRNSASYGDGVYKSVDGGKTWKNMGLKKTFQIGRIAIHPTNPDIVYVGALGRLYGPNEDRGLFKTTDGGKTWNKVHYVDANTGVIDVQLNPQDPESVLIAAWERRRDEFDSHPGTEPMQDGYDGYDPIKKWGAKSGIYKSSDGGNNWRKVTGGLPNNDMGRIGLDFYRKNPNVVFAIVDCAKIGQGPPPNPVYLGVTGDDTPEGAKLTAVTADSPAAKAGLQEGDMLKSVKDQPIKFYEDLVKEILSRKPGDKLTVTVQRGKESKTVEVTLGKRPEDAGQRGVYLGLTGDPTPDGLKVSELTQGGPATKAGVKTGDIIKALDKKPVTNVQQVLDALKDKKPGDKVTLTALRDTKTLEITVPLEVRPQGGRPPQGSNARPYAAFYGGQRENAQVEQGKDGYQYGGLFRSDDGGENWTRINSVNPRPMYFSQVRVDPSNDQNLYVLGVVLYRSSNGGRSFKPDGGNGVHPDQHALWINPKDGRHMIVGTDGGTYATYDRMNHWDHYAHHAIAQFYHVCIDHRQPYRVYGGLQDNGSWGGPSRSLSSRGPGSAEWITVGGGDGFVCRVDAEDPDIVYFESQDGNMARRNLRTGERASLKPQPPRGQPQYRFNWNTPFILSAHNPRVFYSAGNYVFRSVDRGKDQKIISPEITRTKRGSGTALAESPMNPDVLYAGTDDGYLWVTRDGGKSWRNIMDNLASPGGLNGPRWVASIEPSRFVAGRAYVVCDGHRSNDDEPYAFVTEDYGDTWVSLRSNLPWGSTRVLREDAVNPYVLYLGTEFGIWTTINRGDSWTRINNNLPTVAVHEIAVHPTAGEIVAGTHGRSAWVLDVSALRQMKPSLLDKAAHLFKPSPGVRWRSEPATSSPYGSGARHFYGDNPPAGAQIWYSLTRKPSKVKMEIVDIQGKRLRELKPPAEVGLHRVSWDLTRLSLRPGMGQQPLSEPVPPGAYRIVLDVDGEQFSEVVRVEADPNAPVPLTAEEEPVKQRYKGRDD